MTFHEISLHVPEILLPSPGIDLLKWCVIACDQFTSQPEYWEQAAKIVGEQPSALRLILPEAFLETKDEQAGIAAITRSMAEYCEKNILAPQKPGFVLVDRKTARVASRKGLVVALDLEGYDYSAGSGSLIRATEDTIVARLHSRIRIRKNATVELPHIMVLIDDPEKTVIEPLFENNLTKLYDTDLMMNGGHITGYAIQDPALIRNVADNLARLANPVRFQKTYGVTDQPVLLYAMGDGNHSFATAKSLWETVKKQSFDKQAVMDHPLRYALVELVNLHDDGLLFEPIHRVLFNVDSNDILNKMLLYFNEHGSPCTITAENDMTRIKSILSRQTETPSTHSITFCTAISCGTITITNPTAQLTVKSLQTFLDEYLQNKKTSKIDFIHGTDSVLNLTAQPDTIGFFLPPIAKNSLFKTVILEGALPRKAFSMGEADEKRFYCEARKII